MKLDKITIKNFKGIKSAVLEEQRLTRRHIYRKAASGDSNVVLRNILLQIKETGEIARLEAYVTIGLITTHSPFVARALPLGSGVILVKAGAYLVPGALFPLSYATLLPI